MRTNIENEWRCPAGAKTRTVHCGCTIPNIRNQIWFGEISENTNAQYFNANKKV